MKEADASRLDPLVRFTDRVGDYVRYRPSYPAGVIELLRERTGLSAGKAVADVGAGTGIFTRLLLGTGAKVFAVEPNAAMRGAAEAEFAGNERFISVDGTAEATGLPDGAVFLVTCAQAFHWFNPEGAGKEFRRILAPQGWCAVVWNTADLGSGEFAQGYEKIKKDFGTDFGRIRHEAIDKRERFDAFFGAGFWEKRVFPNVQVLDFDGLKGRLQSSSYAPKAGHPAHGPMLTALGKLFDRCQRGGVVRMAYETEVYLGRIGG